MSSTHSQKNNPAFIKIRLKKRKLEGMHANTTHTALKISKLETREEKDSKAIFRLSDVIESQK